VNAAPLSVTAPRNEGKVNSPFAIEGITTPGSTVSMAILAEGGFLRVKVAEASLPVTADGRFSYVFRPTLVVSGVRYIITVKVTGPGGLTSSTTLTVTEQ